MSEERETIDATGGLVPDGEGKGRAAEASRTRWRRRAVHVLAVLTCLGMFVSVVAVWSHRVLFNTDAWIETIGPIAEDPAITDAVAQTVTDEIFKLIKPEDLMKEALPERADFLAAPMTSAMQKFVLDQTQNLLQTEQFQTFWIEANRRVHENVVKLLRGEPVLAFEAQNGVVTLNIMPLISRTMKWIAEKAPRVFGNVTIPDITMDTPPDQARAELSQAFGITVPPTFGVYTVFSSDQLAAAQQAVQLFDKLVFVIVGVTALLLIATIALSLNRRRTLIGLGVGTLLAMVTADAAMGAVEKLALGLIGRPTAREAARVTISQLVYQLSSLTRWLLWGSIVLIVIAFLSGESRLARGIRLGVLRAFGRTPGDGEAEATRTALPLISKNATLLQVAGALVAVLVIALTDVTAWSLVITFVVLGLYELAVYVVASAHRNEGLEAGGLAS
jgi:hypothetical protein